MRVFLILAVVAAIGMGGWYFWKEYQLKQETNRVAREVATLIQYREIYATGRDREANDLLLRTTARLIEAENQGIDIRTVLQIAEIINNTPVNYSDLLTESLLRNMKIARELKMNTSENLERMKEGTSPIVGHGPYTGERAEVDHIVPRSLAPDLDNLLINLELMPQTLNRKKSNKVTERALQVAEKFFEAGVMQVESIQNVRKKWDETSR